VLDDLDSLLKDVPSLFVRRPELFALWHMFSRKHGITAFAFPLFNKTRWCSRWECVQRLIDSYPVLVRFLYIMVHSSLKWDIARPVLTLLTDLRTVVLLHAVADILEPLERSRKLFETSGLRLSDMTAPLRVLSDRLRLLEQCDSLSTFGSKYMNALMTASSSLHVDDGKVRLHWAKYTWSVTLRTCTLSDDCLTQLKNIVRAIGDQVIERSPVGERAFAHFLSIFEIGASQHLSA
jgi:hypothetical protein